MLTGSTESALVQDAVKDSLVGSQVRMFWGYKTYSPLTTVVRLYYIIKPKFLSISCSNDGPIHPKWYSYLFASRPVNGTM
jgi:hypothetical protein